MGDSSQGFDLRSAYLLREPRLHRLSHVRRRPSHLRWLHLRLLRHQPLLRRRRLLAVWRQVWLMIWHRRTVLQHGVVSSIGNITIGFIRHSSHICSGGIRRLRGRGRTCPGGGGPHHWGHRRTLHHIITIEIGGHVLRGWRIGGGGEARGRGPRRGLLNLSRIRGRLWRL